MDRQRRHFTPEQKVALLRLHLLAKKPVSDICQENNIAVNLFYLWQKQFFENGTAAFEKASKPRKALENVKDHKIAALQEKLQRKNEALAELMEEYVQLKKEFGEPQQFPARSGQPGAKWLSGGYFRKL